MDEQIKPRALKNYKHVVGTSYWLIREARSMEDADYVIGMARATGVVECKHVEKQIENGKEVMIAHVVRLNANGTECKPS